MPNLGPAEIIVILAVFATIAALTVGLLLIAVRLAAGHKPQPRPADLATRARALKASGQTERAILLVRGETGMSHDDAARFVHTL
ncbi:high-affinity K+ transport system ATPase subunit B [Thermocatellispora tengchongensis]|uniref:High-affinity K+ transport system ATPase subunit B n=1 Tax=Thermocatellispora tengchongensis TaxID=1073253 RepID=A0A840PIV9_9ACTN|nr:hypothetical protein [Thermocatellispora tengchongensis]MBB5137037.1 high-affinity K+ transport system ATPase subunit B [Thermocatellispora tengchongensis]